MDALLRTFAAQLGKAQTGDSAHEWTRDLTAEARRGKLAPVVGRKEELVQVLEILGQNRKANAVLIGPAGAGKTAIAEGLALLIASRSSSLPAHLKGLKVLALDTGAEHDQVVAADAAFERRFAPVYVSPLSFPATVAALKTYARYIDDTAVPVTTLKPGMLVTRKPGLKTRNQRISGSLKWWSLQPSLRSGRSV